MGRQYSFAFLIKRRGTSWRFVTPQPLKYENRIGEGDHVIASAEDLCEVDMKTMNKAKKSQPKGWLHDTNKLEGGVIPALPYILYEKNAAKVQYTH